MEQLTTPLGKYFGVLTKQYVSILTSKLEELPIDRYFFPLLIIAKNSGEISQKELAKHLFADKVTIVRIIDYLEKMEMVVRVVNDDDRRSYHLFSTQKAERFIPLIENAMHETDELFISFIDPDFRATFKQELKKLTKQIEKIPGERFDFQLDKITQSNENE